MADPNEEYEFHLETELDRDEQQIAVHEEEARLHVTVTMEQLVADPTWQNVDCDLDLAVDDLPVEIELVAILTERGERDSESDLPVRLGQMQPGEARLITLVVRTGIFSGNNESKQAAEPGEWQIRAKVAARYVPVVPPEEEIVQEVGPVVFEVAPD